MQIPFIKKHRRVKKRLFIICRLLSVICYLLFLNGCTTTPQVFTPTPETAIPGVYHRVQKGETLWRISKIYDIDLNEVARINHISEAANIETGQLIFIPRRQKQKYITLSGSEDFIWPLKGRVISYFGQTSKNMINKGLNIQPGSIEEVVAARSGKVIFYADDFKGFGKTVIIDHGDGFSTVYARNSQVFVKVGETVQKGNVISRVGSGGRDKDIYLHFEIRKGHLPQNPYFYLVR
jgi:murein DD-endopeptidase MepM/ murein hydrolase activator NlpD